MQNMTLIVGTDGSAEAEERVRQAAQVARERGVRLHVVCSVPPLPRVEQRKIDAGLPRDLAYLAGPQGQRKAAIDAAHNLVDRYARGVDARISASPLKLAKAERTAAARLGGQIFGTPTPSHSRRLLPRLRPRTA